MEYIRIKKDRFVFAIRKSSYLVKLLLVTKKKDTEEQESAKRLKNKLQIGDSGVSKTTSC
jgi:hypothetical protein